jgi:hypothetical protein
MGNDGGSIPTRRELVKSAARNLTISEMKANALESLGFAWTHCGLTSEPLDMQNVVSDWRGKLYSYESVLKALMPSEESEPAAKKDSDSLIFASTGIKSLRDIVKLKFKRYSPPGTKNTEIWACPLSMKEMGPATKAVYLVPCGHAFAELAIKEIQDNHCPECSAEFERDNVMPILPSEDAEAKRLAHRIEFLRASGLTHSLKKDKSASKKRKADDKNSTDAESRGGKSQNGSTKAAKGDASAKLSGINNPMAASLTAKVLAEQDELNKRRKLASEGISRR